MSAVSQQTAAKYGFIVMDEKGALVGTLSGMTKEILHEFPAEFPKKQLLGRMPALDLATSRLAWVNYERKVADLATHFFIDEGTRQPNVSGLIIAGFEFLVEALSQPGMLDPTLRDKVLCRALVAYAGDSGFNEAIDLSSKYLTDVKFVQEKRLIWKFFAEAMAGKKSDPCNCVLGVEETLKALESGAVKTLLVCENMDISRYIAKNSVTNEISIRRLNEAEEKDQRDFYHLTCSNESEVNDNQFFLKCLAAKYNSAVEFVTHKTQEGHQFCRTFKGIGGILLRNQPGEEKGKGFRDIFPVIK